jgi:hypothetical protein
MRPLVGMDDRAQHHQDHVWGGIMNDYEAEKLAHLEDRVTDLERRMLALLVACMALAEVSEELVKVAAP